MAPLQLNQVNGSNIIVEAAQQVDMFTIVNEVLGFNFGDPFLLEQVSHTWSSASTNVTIAKEMIAPSTRSGTTNYSDLAQKQWTGTAATNFFTQENVLETGFATVQQAMDTVSKQLDSLTSVIWAAWASSVATTLAAIYDLARLMLNNSAAAAAPGAPAQPSAPAPAPVVVPGPGGGSVVLQPANAQPNPPSQGSVGSRLAADAARLAAIAKILREWIAALIAHLVAMWKYYQQVGNTITALDSSLRLARKVLPNGQLLAVPSTPAA